MTNPAAKVENQATAADEDTGLDKLPPPPGRLRAAPSVDAGLFGSGPLPAPETTPTPSIPGYEILGELGRGGMGVVYLARDNDLERTLAIKVLLPEHAEQPDYIQRFLEEARIMAQLQHPGVAPLHEIGALADGRPFFAMKQVKGRTLADLLKARPNPADDLPRMLAIFSQVCQTLAYAHERRIVHRDLKPDNIMVGAFGEVQVMDWGLAKVLTAAIAAASPTPQSGRELTTIHTPYSDLPDGERTRAGSIMGTLAYMAPEQALGQVDLVDQCSDVFGLGAILCEILTGKPPYAAADSRNRHL
ncbi:MAG TPA: serine/threonine-protein kinase, partial [Gemmataceae bacterium]|nr:serine/threonine-protein kinase [Gemmataceae bacterium]